MKGGKILNKLVASDHPEMAVAALGDGKLRKATWQALTSDSTDEKKQRVETLCVIAAAKRFCVKGGEA